MFINAEDFLVIIATPRVDQIVAGDVVRLLAVGVIEDFCTEPCRSVGAVLLVNGKMHFGYYAPGDNVVILSSLGEHNKAMDNRNAEIAIESIFNSND